MATMERINYWRHTSDPEGTLVTLCDRCRPARGASDERAEWCGADSARKGA